MIKYIVLTGALLGVMTCAVLEGLFENLPAQFVQFNGVLALSLSVVLLVWVVKSRFLRVRKE